MLQKYTFRFFQVRSAPILVQVILICSLFFTSFGGLVVASILKKLDNVVKVKNLFSLSE